MRKRAAAAPSPRIQRRASSRCSASPLRPQRCGAVAAVADRRTPKYAAESESTRATHSVVIAPRPRCPPGASPRKELPPAQEVSSISESLPGAPSRTSPPPDQVWELSYQAKWATKGLFSSERSLASFGVAEENLGLHLPCCFAPRR